jgi:hypothetical protein
MWLLAMVIGSFFETKRKDRNRLAHWLGFTGLEMRPHWQRLRTSPSFHALINIGTEWTRADPQRAYKTMAAVIDLLVILLILALIR